MPQTIEDISELSRMLDEVLDLDADRQEAWFAALPATRQHLAPRLREMLARDRTDDGEGLLARGPRLDGGVIDSLEARAGEPVGPYQLIREIGHGGMGTVWLAERSDGSLHRRVALKLPRVAWGAGLVRRMARERDIGAQLEHPNIARLYDAGVDAMGRPYLALEFIDGVPIDVWCRAHELGPRERMRLFVQVARAIAYAHGKLVVHRDLKPSNVLVTPDSQVHLLDFGIAKLLHEAQRDETGLTQAHGRVMTLRYASPEQIEGRPAAVASDIYALGLLLFELLTGRHPHEPERETAGALEDAILQEEPVLASRRASGDRTLQRALRGEVDAILGKALKRWPQDRYANADAFADDVERYLSGHAVLARPSSVWYRAHKTLVRHRIGIAATAAVLVVALGGGFTTLREARRTAAQAERVRLATEFVSELFRMRSAPASGAPDLLDTGSHLIAERFVNQPDLQAELYGTLGRVYSDLGAGAAARDLATRQLALLGRLPEDRARHVRALMLLAEADMHSDRITEGIQRADEAVALASGDQELWLEAIAMLATLQEASGDTAGCVRSLAIADEAIAGSNVEPSRGLARILALQSTRSMKAGRNADSQAEFDRAMRAAQQAEGSNTPTVIELRLRRAMDLIAPEQWPESESLLALALDALRAKGEAGRIRAAVEAERYWSLRRENYATTAEKLMSILQEGRQTVAESAAIVPPVVRAQMDFDLGYANSDANLREAERLYRQSVPVLEASQIPADRLLFVLDSQANTAMEIGRFDEADALIRRALSVAERLFSNHRSELTQYWLHLAENLSESGRWDAAEAFLDAQFLPARAADGHDDIDYRRLDFGRAEIKLDRGDPESARRLVPGIGTLEGYERRSGWRLAIYGEIECLLGDKSTGLTYLHEAIETARKVATDDSPSVARYRSTAGLCALASGDRAQAQALAVEARRAFTANPGASPYVMAPLVKLEAALGASTARRVSRSPGGGAPVS